MRTCVINGCDEDKIAAKGMCWKHYARSRRKGSTEDPDYLNSGKTCSFIDCDGKAIAGGICRKHQYRLNEHGDPHKLVRTQTKKGDTCIVPRCGETVKSSVFCHNHYNNYRYHLRRENIKDIPEYLLYLRKNSN
ncbi:hypothetical protein bcgnr5372_37970 [Bacillus luti]|nr:hypothetical protein [Bacillus cereus]HDR8329485.1 hypothetical protein [Bacillus cereus]HDR8337571.1 hypothetical protein [Bacillus cereus]